MAPLIHFITGNANKLREVKAILEPGIEIRSQSLDLEEIQGTIEEVANSKCRRAADLVRPSFYNLLVEGKKNSMLT
jgi:inosine triphosphate pyrophosphatase